MISAVWLVRSHQIAADLRYWLTYIGYDRRDHSLSHKIYLVYATTFFAAWIFATLTLLASWVGKILNLAGGAAFDETPIAIVGLTLALIGWWLFFTVRAGQYSPITFSEDDAALICQTPASRPAIALMWLLGDWIKVGPAFWALGITLSFALQDHALGTAVSVEYVPRYIFAGFKILLLVVPLQWGLMAFGYAWGVLRLQRGQVRRYWWLLPAILAVFLLIFMAAQAPGKLLEQTATLSVLQPLVFPISGGYGQENWGIAWLVSFLWGGLGTLSLGYASRELNLSRAAQESSVRSSIDAALQSGNLQTANEISVRRRLGAGHAPSHLPVIPGWQGLMWKVGIIWNRRGPLALLGSLVIIFLTSLAVALAPDWGARIWTVFAWLVAVQQFSATPLADDLRLWVFFRGLPFSGRQVLLGEMLLPAGFVILVSGLAVFVAQPLSGLLPLGGGLPTGWMILLVPGAAFGCVLAAALDILRNCHSGRLLTGHVPMPGTMAVMVGGLIVGAGGLTIQFIGDGPLGYLYGGVILCGLSYMLLDFVSDTLGRIE